MADDPPSPSPSPLPHRPQSVREGESTTLSPQACRRCRKKKLACSRELPICKRCGRIAAICEYPPPPDRKALAAIRSRNALARAQGEAGNSGGLPEQQQFAVDAGTWNLQQSTSSIGLGDHATSDTAGPEAYARHQQRRQSGSEDYRDSTPLQPMLRKTTLPSSEVAVFLFEIYFSRIYSASLLFHKEKFLSDYNAGTVPDFVALSIFACSSIFLRQTPGRPRQDNGEDEASLGISMLSVADATKQGLEWATAASQRVLIQADVPCLHTIQACQSLVLYWFAAGEGDRAHIHAHIAYKTAVLLNLHVQKEADDQIEGSELLDELGRRCFWSCWITSCISQDNADFKSVPWKEAVGLMFPSDEDSWASRKPISTQFFNDSGSVEPGSLCLNQQPSVMGEMVKACCLWWEIQRSIKQHKNAKPSEFPARVAAHFELDQRLSVVFEALHPDLRYLNASSFKSGKLDPYKLVALQSHYHLCFCALHSSIVPVFSDFVKNPAVSGSLLRISALESVKHADLILDMATAFMNTRLDPSRLPSIVGFAMFVASAIHFKSLVAQRKLRAHGLARFKAAVSILECLKEYWVVLRGLWSVLESVAASHRVDINKISKSDIRTQRNPEEEFTDVERIASHERLSQDAESTDIYTYVPYDVIKNAASPRRHSHSPADTTGKLSKSSPLSSKITADSTPGQYGQEINAPPAVGQTTLDNNTFTLAHQQLHTPQSFSSQQNHELEQIFIGNPQSMPHDMGRMNAVMPRGFTPLEPTAEEYQMQGQTAGPSHISATQPLVGFGGLNESIDVTMTDWTYTWWDQPFESFEVDNQFNLLQEGGIYPFNTWSFGQQS